MAKKVKRSVAPIYAVAAVWLVFGLFLPLYRPIHYVAAALTSVLAYVLVRALCPDRVYETPEPKAKAKAAPEEKPQEPPKAREPEKPASTGDPELDALILERDRAVSEMKRLNDAIEDEGISRRIDQLEDATGKIIDQVIAHPEKLPQIRKFMNYYLPTTLKILNAYDRMGAAGVSGENIDGTMHRIETIMDTIVMAFHKQLDALFRDEAMDIASDITVMETLLAQEGLAGDQPDLH